MTKDTVKASLRYSLLDGFFASLMIGFTQDYFVPFLLQLGASTREIGIFAAISVLVPSLIQLKTCSLVSAVGSRKQMITRFVFLQSIFAFIIMVMILTNHHSTIQNILLITCFLGAGAIAGPAWSSMMSDLVPECSRGKYFGWRGRILGFMTVGGAFSAGMILHYGKSYDPYIGFAILFFGAFFFRMISWYFLTRMSEPPVAKLDQDNRYSLGELFQKLRHSNFARFTGYVSLLSFAMSIAGPFFSVFLLHDLDFDYRIFTSLNVIMQIVIYSSIKKWGIHADRVGNVKVIHYTSRMIVFTPLLWIFYHNPLYLLVLQIFAGFAWAGYSLSSTNFVYDAVVPEKRTRYIAYFNAINGFCTCLGAFFGGLLAPHMPPLFGYPILSLFLISFILRFLVVYLLPIRISEVRPTEKTGGIDLFFSMLRFRSTNEDAAQISK